MLFNKTRLQYTNIQFKKKKFKYRTRQIKLQKPIYFHSFHLSCTILFNLYIVLSCLIK